MNRAKKFENSSNENSQCRINPSLLHGRFSCKEVSKSFRGKNSITISTRKCHFESSRAFSRRNFFVNYAMVPEFHYATNDVCERHSEHIITRQYTTATLRLTRQNIFAFTKTSVGWATEHTHTRLSPMFPG